MNAFGHYSRYYDLLYRDKDYAGEAKFVLAAMERTGLVPSEILELGCGTGKHAACFAQAGLRVAGVDLSQGMIEQARSLFRELPGGIANRGEFFQGDIRHFELGKQFNAIVSLFHVMNYQATPEDFAAALGTVASHLTPGGVFLFDSWYGPGVLLDPPQLRFRELEDDVIKVSRIAIPQHHQDQQTVDVRYLIYVRDKTSGVIEEIEEVHTMRYLFADEVEVALDRVGLELVESGGWMRRAAISEKDWAVYFVARRRG
jgi:SAM-dependent methyltransferase